MAYKKGERPSIATEFKQGNRPVTALPVGSITTRIDKNGKGRRWIKISEPNKWIPYAQFVWIECGGNIPSGFILHHIDGDTMNDDTGNLSLVTRSLHISIHREDLLASKVGLVLNKKSVVCSRCGSTYMANAQRRNGLCDECRINSTRESRSRSKKRIRAEKRERRSNPT